VTPSLEIGSRVGPYEILGVLGAGGMGEVYRARDAKLQRDVAIKVLPASMENQPRRLARFEREARALAALNHPNIATVFTIEAGAMVMELVPGVDLSWRLKDGPLPIVDCLAIARQVAGALEAAHNAGIVHRDLKPANIKVRADGGVKVLDFGLAKGAEDEAPSALDKHDDTISEDLTADGSRVGTAAYMAPEQARGEVVDKRADIWSFGVVVFEMLTGRPPFAASTAADTLARVMAAEPDWSALPAGLPATIRTLLARCLSKDRKRRLHDIADARIEIEDAATGRDAEASREQAGFAPWVPRLAGGAVALLVGMVLGASAWREPQVAPALLMQARLGVAPAAELNAHGVHRNIVLPAAGSRTAMAWAPDGQRLAFIGVQDGVRRIYLRNLADAEARPLAGTEGASDLAFSPDGGEIAFWSDRALRRIAASGGPVVRLTLAGVSQGLFWSQGGIYFVDNPGIYVVSPTGGPRQQVTTPPELVRHTQPVVLPGGRALLYTEHQRQWTSGSERVMALSLDAGARPRVIVEQAADARYLPTGHLAFLRQGSLFVAPFNADTLALDGNPVAVLNGVSQAVAAWDSDDLTLAGQFAISPTGTLAYVAQPLATYPGRELVAFDRAGRVTTINAPIMGYRSGLALAPDGRRLAVSVQSNGAIELFTFDLLRHTLSPMTVDLKGELIVTSWAREQIAVDVVNDGHISSVLVQPDAISHITPVDGTKGVWSSSLSATGLLAGMREGDVWVFDVRKPDSTPVQIPTGSVNDTQPAWSPDGRWMAYTAPVFGRAEVHLRPFPGPGEVVLASRSGGTSPAWNPNGKELFYVEPDSGGDRMMAVDVSDLTRPGEARSLFTIGRDNALAIHGLVTPYVVSPDGSRFYAVRTLPRSPTPVTEIQVVLGWFETLRTRVPYLP